MRMAEELQHAPVRPIPGSHGVVAEDEALAVHRDGLEVRDRGPAETRGLGVVVVADDEMLRAAELPEDRLHPLLVTAVSKVAQVPYDIVPPDHRVPIRDEAGVHLLDAVERA